MTLDHIFTVWFCCIPGAMHMAWHAVDIQYMVHDGRKERRKEGRCTEGKTEGRKEFDITCIVLGVTELSFLGLTFHM